MNQLITLSVLTYAKIINLSWILKVFNFLDISVTLFWIAILFLDVHNYWSFDNIIILLQILKTKRTFHYWKKKNWLYPGYLLDMSQKPRSLPPQSTRALTSSFLSSSSLVLTSSLSVSETTLLLLWLWLEWPSWLWFNSRFFRPAKKFVCLPNPNSWTMTSKRVF